MITVLCAGMGVSLIAYVQRSLKGGYVSQLMTKTVTSLFFVLIALAAHTEAGKNKLYFTLVLLGLVCSLAGDIFIQAQKAGDRYSQQMLAAGVGSFFVAHCFYIAAFVLLCPFSIWDLAVFAVCYAMLRGVFLLKRLNFGKMLIPGYIYLGAIMLMFVKALSLTYMNGGFTVLSALLMSAAALFVASDTMLTFINFYPPCKNSRLLSSGVSITYYVAQTLFALSILYV